MKVSESEVTVAEFYEPVMSRRPPAVQRLVIQLLRSEFKQAAELEANILKAAALSREPTTNDINQMDTKVEENNLREGRVT